MNYHMPSSKPRTFPSLFHGWKQAQRTSHPAVHPDAIPPMALAQHLVRLNLPVAAHPFLAIARQIRLPLTAVNSNQLKQQPLALSAVVELRIEHRERQNLLHALLWSNSTRGHGNPDHTNYKTNMDKHRFYRGASTCSNRHLIKTENSPSHHCPSRVEKHRVAASRPTACPLASNRSKSLQCSNVGERHHFQMAISPELNSCYSVTHLEAHCLQDPLSLNNPAWNCLMVPAAVVD
mmetsp:Transcript_58038/g.106140  ORF Transcript_58038/g.106140 Transcript_58038/m.106140 type:complete len:235 (-) Transcript_58038:638-1342(-)